MEFVAYKKVFFFCANSCFYLLSIDYTFAFHNIVNIIFGILGGISASSGARKVIKELKIIKI